MSDATVARLIGSAFGILGIALGAVAVANDWTLFHPFAIALIGSGVLFHGIGWSLRQQNSGPGSARLPAR